MEIKKLKIHHYGKLKEKEINLEDHINVIYGTNEAGKSTILHFIVNAFYGISKNKKGKELSDFEKYKPWQGEDFSGKIEYSLDTGKSFEIFRDFKKKNPKILNEQMEDIAEQFNVSKSTGNEFFYEQTKMSEELFLSTLLVNQQEVLLEKQDQNVLVQKIANLVGTGEDNVSYKRAMDRINRRQLEEIGTQKSREKPINLITKKIEELESKRKELKQYEDSRYEIEENQRKLQEKILKLEEELTYWRQRKEIEEKQNIEYEKIKIKENLQKENFNKINLLQKEVEFIQKEEENKRKEKLEKNKKIKMKKNQFNQKYSLFFILIIILNVLQFILMKNLIFNSIFLLTVPTFLIFWFFSMKKKKIEIQEKENKEKIIENKEELEKNELINQITLLKNQNYDIEKEIKENKSKINSQQENLNFSEILQKIEILQKDVNDKNVELHLLHLDQNQIEPRLNELAKIEEDLVYYQTKMINIKKQETSMNLAKEMITLAYEKMKNSVTPKFTKNLSETIQSITNGKYTNVKWNEESGLMIELENGNYEPISRLSVGTIDQLYLSLRLSMAEELSKEKMPIILDESFAYYDTDRLKNVLKYLKERFQEHQIILLTCTSREKELLEELEINYHFVEL